MNTPPNRSSPRPNTSLPWYKGPSMTELQKRVMLLERALRPFARWYKGSFTCHSEHDTGEKLYPVEANKFHPTVLHLRKAWDVLEKK